MNRQLTFRTFSDAKTFVHSLNLKSQKEWKEYCNTGKIPNDIPKHPEKYYKGWRSWEDWFGTGPLSSQETGQSIEKVKVGNDIRTFLNIIKIEKSWKYFEVRACALKNKEKDLVFAYVKLGKIKGKNKIFVSDNHKLYTENFKIDELENFLIRLSKNCLRLNDEQLSFQLRNYFFYDFKERKYSTYIISYCQINKLLINY